MNTFICDMCGEVSERSSDGEAEAELKHCFGSVPIEDCDMVCDACWEQVKPSRNPEAYMAWLASGE